MSKLTSFELGGISGITVILGDMFWLVKDALHLNDKYYIIVGIVLVIGLAWTIASMVRYEKRRAISLAKKAKIKAAKRAKAKRAKGVKK